jgi:hypothetical protein
VLPHLPVVVEVVPPLLLQVLVVEVVPPHLPVVGVAVVVRLAPLCIC